MMILTGLSGYFWANAGPAHQARRAERRDNRRTIQRSNSAHVVLSGRFCFYWRCQARCHPGKTPCRKPKGIVVPNANSSLPQRSLLTGGNALKIGLFGANCSSGRAVTKVPERWSGTWDDNLALARMADEAGIDFLLPIGRWKGYGGDTGYQEATLETVTWACGLLAATRRITVFGTVHAPLFHPVIAAKQMVTADHIGEGRFGLNIVVGWNEGEFEMFGVEQRAHATRYEYAQEWIDAIKLMWSAPDDFDFDGAVHQAEERARQAEALRRHAAGHHERRRVAGRPRLRGAQLRCVLHAVVARLGRGDRAAGRRA